MKLSFSTNAFENFTVFEAVEAIGSIGYEGIEILADAPHLFPPSVTEEDVMQLNCLLKEKGLQVANINSNTATGYYGREFWEPVFEPSLANPDASARKWRVEYSRRCIDLAHELGSSCVSLTSGRMVPGTKPQESRKLLQQSLNELIPHAEEKDIYLGIEYEPGLLIERCSELKGLIDEMASSHLGVNLDVGHSFVIGEKVPEVIETLSDRIFHVHLEDIKDGKHYHLIPGEGDMDFKSILKALEGQAYEGFVTVELYTYLKEPRDAAQRALAFLRNLG